MQNFGKYLVKLAGCRAVQRLGAGYSTSAVCAPYTITWNWQQAAELI
jgi:hypothetical protein